MVIIYKLIVIVLLLVILQKRFSFVRFAYCTHIHTRTLKVRKLDVAKFLIIFEEYKSVFSRHESIHHNMPQEAQGGVGSGVTAPVFHIISVLNRAGWSTQISGRFTPGIKPRYR